MKKAVLIMTLFVVALTLLAGCSTSKDGAPKKFVIAYLPGENSDQAQKLNGDFEKKLSEKLGIPVESYKATSYNAAIEAMKNGKADYALFGPFSYIVAVDRANVEPVAEISIPAMANQPASVILVKKDSPIQTLADLKGKTFGYVDPVSTTGHLLPKSILVDQLGITPDEVEKGFFKDVQFAGGHDKAILGLLRGQYDAIGTAAMMPAMLEAKGIIEKDSYRVIGQSQSLPGTALGIRKDLPEDLKAKVKEFLLSYDNPEYLEGIVGSKDAKFIEAKDSDFDGLRDIAKKLNLSPDDLLK
ncbi:phosphate/phosphite/phosphonate ABC transporter substrate-binding protein [Paenibacillus sp. JDR-2]|uniref:phosphate/phosphite/phosphonate ABC transporter substrate-binding protein n=1 Tax=Paenibacillus sp. (strain JDR-2) TaxID=324057 RepID=UPI000166ABEF|nr:phosphate/phosphite/phosphonate ABC transporter substrate-binding protein [Paenibacillus sp. JDR-2]ACT04616.1 phosphonate ABC transporter, periplasmic phosphonate-binding protein [Paenibacillus sp. JDR-2]